MKLKELLKSCNDGTRFTVVDKLGTKLDMNSVLVQTSTMEKEVCSIAATGKNEMAVKIML